MKKNIAVLIRLNMSWVICIVMICGLFPTPRETDNVELYPAYHYHVEAAEVSAGVFYEELIAVDMNPTTVEIVLSPEQEAELLMRGMTMEQKAGQLFFCAFRRNQNGNGIIKTDANIEKIIKDCGIGGVVLFSENIINAQQVTDYIHSLQQASDVPLFIGIDEEGGRVVRTKALDVPRIPSALSIGNTNNTQNAYNTAKTISDYLAPLGFNVDFAPVADVFTNPSNTVIGDRAFSSDANKAAEMVKSFVKGALDSNILPAVKHFPGHGDTKEDSHFGIASTQKTLAELSKCEFIPFQAGIDAGAVFVMTGHITTPNIDKDNGDNMENMENMPATFSNFLLQDVLRGNLGFNGIIITDSLEMGAIINRYTSEETAVNAIIAGVDMLLMPHNIIEAYNGVLKAVKSGKISEKRIDESVKRILTEKYKADIITSPDKLECLKTYGIKGDNYVKLRDIAYILNGTEKQFEIGFDSAINAVSLTSGKPYTAVGGEISDINISDVSSGSAHITHAIPADVKIYLNGREISLTAYNIGGNNYFKLRDIAKVLDFKVMNVVSDADDAKNTVAIYLNEKYTDN